MTIWNPRQIATKHVDGQGRRHENRSYPEAPVTMHAPPVRPWIGFASAVTIPFGVVLVSSHNFSISGESSPLRAALLQFRLSQGRQSTIQDWATKSPVNFDQNS
jgi:hypothetical protein